jgi:hypothetical protein
MKRDKTSIILLRIQTARKLISSGAIPLITGSIKLMILEIFASISIKITKLLGIISELMEHLCSWR